MAIAPVAIHLFFIYISFSYFSLFVLHGSFATAPALLPFILHASTTAFAQTRHWSSSTVVFRATRIRRFLTAIGHGA